MKDEPKIIDLKIFNAETRAKADDQTMDRVWKALADLWVSYAEEAKNKQIPDELCLSGEPTAVFSVLLENLVAMAKATKIENDDILEMLLSLMLVECEPKGRLHQLLQKASNILEYGDEDAWEKMLRDMHAAGKLTEEQLANELKR